jgi:hypothetical protein
MLDLAGILCGSATHAAKVMMRLHDDDGQYSGFPNSYPVMFTFFHTNGRFSGCVRVVNTMDNKIYRKTVAIRDSLQYPLTGSASAMGCARGVETGEARRIK